MPQVIDLEHISSLPSTKRRAAGETLIDLGKEIVRSADTLDALREKVERQTNGARTPRVPHATSTAGKPKRQRAPRRVRNEFGELVTREERDQAQKAKEASEPLPFDAA